MLTCFCTNTSSHTTSHLKATYLCWVDSNPISQLKSVIWKPANDKGWNQSSTHNCDTPNVFVWSRKWCKSFSFICQSFTAYSTSTQTHSTACCKMKIPTVSISKTEVNISILHIKNYDLCSTIFTYSESV